MLTINDVYWRDESNPSIKQDIAEDESAFYVPFTSFNHLKIGAVNGYLTNGENTWPGYMRRHNSIVFHLSRNFKQKVFNDVEKVSVGKDAYLRTVYIFRGTEEFGFHAGLTVHSAPGTWSSYPPHKFEAESILSPSYGPYKAFREKFAYITDPPGGWGLQIVVTGNEGKFSHIWSDRDIVDIPLSNHAVVAGPETIAAYFWLYTGGGEKFKDGKRV